MNSYWDKPTAARMNQYTTAIRYIWEVGGLHITQGLGNFHSGTFNFTSAATAGTAMLAWIYYCQHCIMSRQPSTSATLSWEDLINPKPFLGLFKTFTRAHRKTGANKTCRHATTSISRNTRVLRPDAGLDIRALGWPLQESAEDNQSLHWKKVWSERYTEKQVIKDDIILHK